MPEYKIGELVFVPAIVVGVGKQYYTGEQIIDLMTLHSCKSPETRVSTKFSCFSDEVTTFKEGE
jgi:hypothetical protein